MKKKHLENTLTALKNGLAKNAVTPEGEALIQEITQILADLANDPDVEYDEADILAKVTETAKSAGAAAAAEVANAFKGKIVTENKMDKEKVRGYFAEAMRNAAGKGKGAFATEFKELCAKNGITGLPSLVEVFPEIQTKFEKTSILSKLRKLGNQSLKFGISAQADDATDVRARGYTAYDTDGVLQGKVDQNLILTPKTLSLGAIYKKITIPKLMSYQTGNDTQLFNWLANELVERIDNEIQRVILVGDGRLSTALDHITSFETIGTKTADDAYTVYDEVSNVMPTLANVRAMIDQMDNSKPITLYAHPATITGMQAYQYASGGAVSYISDEILASQLGVAEIVRTKMLAGAVPAPVVAAATYPLVIAIQGDGYGYVGSDLFSVDYEKWDYNADVLMAEIFAGGGVIRPLSTGVLKVAVPAEA